MKKLIKLIVLLAAVITISMSLIACGEPSIPTLPPEDPDKPPFGITVRPDNDFEDDEDLYNRAPTKQIITLSGGATFADGSVSKEVDSESTLKFGEDIICSVPENRRVAGWIDQDGEFAAGQDIFVPIKDATYSPAFDVPVDVYGPDENGEGKVYLYPMNGGGNFRAESTIQMKTPAVVGEVGDELGTIFDLAKTDGSAIKKGDFAMIISPFAIDADNRYTTEVKVKNFGSESVTLKFYVTGQGSVQKPADAVSEEITLAPDAIQNVQFDFKFKSDNSNEMLTFEVLNEGLDSLNLGVCQYISIARTYNLTLSDGAKFADNSVTAALYPGEKPEIIYTSASGEILTGWVNAEDPAEIFDVEFVMPRKDITIKPVTEKPGKHTLTVEGAAFGDDTASKLFEAGDTVNDLKVPEIEGKNHVGWVNKDDKSEYFGSVTFTMPNKDLTIIPVYDVSDYAPTDGSMDGKVSLYPKDGKGNYRNESTLVKKSAVVGVVGNELGSVFELESSGDGIVSGDFGMIISPYAVKAEITYESTIIIENRGSEDLQLKFYVTGSGTVPKPENSCSEVITVGSGETQTVSFDFIFSADNKNEMLTFEVLNEEPIDGMTVGICQYISVKA